MTAAGRAASPPHHLVVGSAQHGVTRYAELLITAGQVTDDRVTRLRRAIGPADLDEVAALLPRTRSHVHIHLTDHLIGRSPEEAASVVTALAARHRISLTLHDLPQPSDGRVQPRRAAAYAAMTRAAVATVVSSHHEHALLTTALLTTPLLAAAPQAGRGETSAPAITVIPLAVEAARSVVAQPARPGDVAVLGWVYPGKGHAEVLDALAGLPAAAGLTVLGRASPGHEHLLDDLRGRATELDRRLTVTGWVPDGELATMIHSVAVPVVAHRHISASGSLATWLSAGRRPVVTRSPYTEEFAHRLPGALTLVEDKPASLSRALAAALGDPSSTWLDDSVVLGPSPVQAAAALDSWLARWAR